MPDDFQTGVIPALQAIEHPVAVGYSGGLDSTVLLHLLAGDDATRGNGLRAIHVHHGLHADADAWAAHCQATCDALGIELIVPRVEVDADAGVGPEAAARRARHDAFEAELREGEVLALAHHRDDQAETFLLRALRASGPDGLAAMREWRSFGSGWMWRPLLGTPRDAIRACAQANGLDWIEDPSNASTDFDRNFLRHRVMPLLEERWPHAGDAFARSARLQQDAVDLLADEDARALVFARTLDPHVLSVTAMRTLPPSRRARVLRRWIAGLSLPALPAQGIDQIERQLLPVDNGEACFQWSGTVVQRWRDLLHADVARGPLPGDWQVDWDGCRPLTLPTGDRLSFVPDSPCLGTAVTAGTTDDDDASRLAPLAQRQAALFLVHARRGGERIVLRGRDHSHSLKHVLQELGVPPWERRRLPLLSNGDGTLLAAGNLVYSAGFDAWLREQGMRLAWTRSPALHATHPSRR